MTTVLNGHYAIELVGGMALARAGLLLSQSGADVVRVALAGEAALLSDVQDALWNRGKANETIDLASDAGKARLAELLAGADMLIHDRLPSRARALGLDAATLDAAYPKLIHVAIGGWPFGHAKQETPVSDGLVLAEAGILDEQAAVNRDGPIWLRFPLGSSHAGYLAVVGALARLYARARTGRGGPVYTSLIQGALVPLMMHWQRAEHPTPSIRFGMPKDSGATLFECADGLWIHTMGMPFQAPAMQAALDAMDAEERTAYNAKYAGRVIKYLEDWGAIEAVFKTRPRAEWLELLWAADVPVQPVLPMGALYTDEQSQANGYVIDVDDPRFGATRQPGAPMQVDWDGPAARAASAPEARAMAFPLDGLKVLDIGNFLAGPLAPMMLADLGADVIKLEATSGDPMRPGEWAFNGCQRNKRDVAVQLKDPQGRAVMERLVDWADVVHHNQRVPAAEKLGFGYAAVHARNPKAIYCHVSSYGPKGPRKDWPGYDQLFQSSAGWEYEGAGEGNPPMWHRFGMMDHLGALASVVATLLALIRRDRTGEGEFVAASLLGASLASVETLQLADGSLAPYPRLDSAQMGISNVERLYQCADGWIAVDAPGKALPAGFGEASALAGTADQALATLKGAGLPAVRVALGNRDGFLDDPANRAARIVATFSHPTLGRFEHIGALWDFVDLGTRLDLAPPMLGQHSNEILESIGIDQAGRDALLAAGVVKQAG